MPPDTRGSSGACRWSSSLTSALLSLPFPFLVDVSQTLKLQLSGLSAWVDGLSHQSSDDEGFEALKVDSPTSLPIGSDQRKAAEAVLEASISTLVTSADQQPFILILTPPGTGRAAPSRRQVDAASVAVAAAPKRVGSGPVFSIDQCFTTVEACTNATDVCSGRGECVGTKRAGKTCFSCECGATTGKDGVTQWAGARCEKRDVSSCVLPPFSPFFHLLAQLDRPRR
jgi:hypothetical protein